MCLLQTKENNLRSKFLPFFFLLCLYFQFRNGGGVGGGAVKYFSLETGFTSEKV